ncbi:serine/threonine-protein kinase OXI1-like [Corylus avellana]|uniref:serine/threonine-protein kinase OXI1-like n=1 Tax=Corylus avellana TaxID=13451 RepID=UPI001E20026A|nr:serine/threonine-protein kinase OXI1-like [Corylus avellana]
MKLDEEDREIPALDFQNFKVISAVGRGAKGVVFLAKDEVSDEFVALKVIAKALIEGKGKADGGEYKRIFFEQQVLRRLSHPLLPRLRGVLATENVVAHAIDYCPGGNLHSLRKRQTEKMFSDDVIRFYAAELVLALEYLHSFGIVYRDLKPENVMIQENGHIMLVDFDLSTRLSPKSPRSTPESDLVPKSNSVKKKRLSPLHRFCNSGILPEDSISPGNSVKPESDPTEKCNSFVGTEEYVAPEIVLGNGHDFAVDWWSLGVVLYEMLYGTTPFRGSNRKETFYRILSKTPELTGETTPLRDLIAKMLEKDPEKRIELEGIKGHDFFRGIEWDYVLGISRPPFVPQDETGGIEGNKNIDAELFVQSLVGNGEADVDRVVENNNNHKTTEIDKFLIF